MFDGLLLAFAAVALGAYTVASIGIGLALRTPLLAVGAWCGALVAAAAHVLLTPRLGPSGAAVATLAGYTAVAGLTFVLAQRVHPLPYRGGRAAGLFALQHGQEALLNANNVAHALPQFLTAPTPGQQHFGSLHRRQRLG
jgi:hypothetical protein